MSKWIDVDDLRACINILADKMTDGGAMAIKQAVNIADSLPSIDIVRCKECRYKDIDICPMYGLVVAGVRKADDYCSYGERKSNES